MPPSPAPAPAPPPAPATVPLARHRQLQQALITSRDHLDRELARFTTLQRYATAAFATRSDADFAELTAEAMVEAFDLEFGLLCLHPPGSAPSTTPAAVVGIAPAALSPALVSGLWARVQAAPSPAAQLLDATDPLLTDTALAQLVLAPCTGPDGAVLGLLIGGLTRAGLEVYAPLAAARGEALWLLAQQAGAQLRNRHDALLIRTQLETIQVSEQRLAQALDGGSLGLWEWHVQTGEVHFSDLWMAMLGRAPDSLPHALETWLSLMHPDDVAEAEARVNAHLAGESATYTNEHRLRHAEGHWVWIQARGKLIRDEAGAPLRMIGIHVDITERRAAEEAVRQAAEAEAQAREAAERANRSKSVFLASMSHEIRTPMNGVMGMIQLLLATELNAEQRSLARSAHDAGRSLLTIIDDILDLSKIEAGRLTLERVPYRPAPLIRQVAELVATPARDKHLALRLELAPDTDAAVLGDPVRVRQVLTNLVGNAVKFTAAGHVCVRARQRPATGPTGVPLLEVAVEDTGIGISREAQQRLFSPFSQAELSTTRRFGGTGLGLAISRRLVEQMGGSIAVESTEGQGTTFTFTVEAPPSAAPVAPGHWQPPAARPAAPGTGRVLVVDDSAINRQVAARMLEKLGLEVMLAASGEEALALQAAEPADLVLMDLNMPGLGGLETTRRLRASGPRVPVLALTASAMDESRQACLAAGMDDFLTKPIRWAHLAEVVARWLPPGD